MAPGMYFVKVNAGGRIQNYKIDRGKLTGGLLQQEAGSQSSLLLYIVNPLFLLNFPQCRRIKLLFLWFLKSALPGNSLYLCGYIALCMDILFSNFILNEQY